MSSSSASWPCPACAELIPPDQQGCPRCRLSPDWVDLLRALDFAVRCFFRWKLDGALSAAEYRRVVASCGERLDRLLGLALAGQPAPADSGLPPRCTCWSCGLT